MKFKVILFIFIFLLRSKASLTSLAKSSVNLKSSSDLQDASYTIIQSEITELNKQDEYENNSGDVVIDRDASNTTIIIIMITLVVILVIFLVVRIKTQRQTDAIVNMRRSYGTEPQNETDADILPINVNASPEQVPRSRDNQSNYGTFS